jgi:hypothetical protein
MRTSALLYAIGLMLLSGCANTTTQPAESSSPDRWTLSQPVTTYPPENTEGQPYTPRDPSRVPSQSWYTNADRTLWMLNRDRVSGKPLKTAWMRPHDTQLAITGRRLDGDAPPLIAEVPPTRQYPGRMFTPTKLTFPTDGIWEITGRAGNSELRVVVTVPSKPPA